MSGSIATAVIAASGAVILAGATYWFTKQRERDAELRKEKLEHYKAFAIALSGIISGEGTREAQREFALACNKLNLVAPQQVLQALQAFQQASKSTAPSELRGRHDELMSILFYQMRRDLRISPKDERETFKVGLWASGVPRDEP
jgi:hypothetical protein